MHCGIDFGTSNTTLSIRQGDKPHLIALENNKTTIPSALFFPADKFARPLFGRAAVNAYLNGEEGRFMRSLKRVLGTSIMQSGTTINGKRFGFPVLIGLFLRHIKDIAEQESGEKLTSVTMGRPVHFQDKNPDADIKAEEELRAIATTLGFKKVDFQYEPIAGAIAHERHLKNEQLAMVIDIGGGTSDFSVIRLSPDNKPGRDRKKDILANSGIRIGGNDCDKAINLHTAMPLLGMGGYYGEKNLEIPSSLYFDLSEWSKILFSYTPQNKTWTRQLISMAQEPEKIMLLEQVLDEQLAHKILNISEETKITLSEEQQATLDYHFLQHDLRTDMSQEIMNNLFQKT
ncbi:MAG TPA: Hsp70 family protein, partial [Alphaproteobacteria bacterium]